MLLIYRPSLSLLVLIISVTESPARSPLAGNPLRVGDCIVRMPLHADSWLAVARLFTFAGQKREAGIRCLGVIQFQPPTPV